MTSTAPPLTPDLIAGLKRVRLAHFRPVIAEAKWGRTVRPSNCCARS